MTLPEWEAGNSAAMTNKERRHLIDMLWSSTIEEVEGMHRVFQAGDRAAKEILKDAQLAEEKASARVFAASLVLQMRKAAPSRAKEGTDGH